MDYREILDQVSKNAKIAGEYITEKAILAKDYTVLTGEITSLRNRINTLYKLLGKAVYAAHSGGIDNAAQIDDYLTELDAKLAEVAEKEQQRNALKER